MQNIAFHKNLIGLGHHQHVASLETGTEHAVILKSQHLTEPLSEIKRVFENHVLSVQLLMAALLHQIVTLAFLGHIDAEDHSDDKHGQNDAENAEGVGHGIGLGNIG